jgi:hypothetical protein
LTWSACVHAMPCGAPSMTTYSLPLMASWVRAPQASMGSTRSPLPCMTKTGMSIFGRSARKSVCRVGTQAMVPVGDAPAAVFQASRTASSLMRVPRFSSRL